MTRDLKGVAKTKWDELQPQFDLSSLLTVELLLQYCEAFALHRRASEELESEELIHTAPNGAPYPDPRVNIIIKTSDQMRRLYAVLKSWVKQQAKEEDDLLA